MLGVRISIAIMLAGCGRIGFDLSTGGTGVDGGGGSGDPDGGGSGDPDGGSSACSAAVPSTTFPGGSPCANWGANVSFTNAGLSESGGTLIITPNVNDPSAEGRCDRQFVTIGPAGAFTEVSQVVAGMSSQTRLEILWGGETYYIGASNNGMRAGAIDAGLTFSGGAVARWWRIRPLGSNIEFETSADGVLWDSFGSMGGVPSGQATLRTVARTPVAVAAPGMARFESVNVCP